MDAKLFKIIEFRKSDLKSLRELFQKARQNTFVWVDPTTFDLLDFDKETQGEYVLTALYDEKVIGFISVWMPTNFIHHLYIDEAFHKRGIGKELLKTVIEKTSLPIRLKCLEKNTAAIQFYKKLGFAERDKGESENGSYFVMKLFEDIK